MTPERAEEFMRLPELDGLILGSAGTRTDWVRLISGSVQKNSPKSGGKGNPSVELEGLRPCRRLSGIPKGFGRNRLL
jgi:hypothetical protein